MEICPMQIPDAEMISKKPVKVKCPECFEVFDITQCEGSNGQERLDALIADYEAHYLREHMERPL